MTRRRGRVVLLSKAHGSLSEMGRIRRSGRWFGAFTTLCAFLYAPNRWARKHHIRWTPALERRRQFVLGWLYLRAGSLTVNAEGRPIARAKLKRIYTRPSPWLRGRLDDGDRRDHRGLGDLVPTVLGKTREIIDTDDRQVTAHPLDAPLARLDATLARPDDAPAVQNALDAIEQDIVLALTRAWRICPLCARAFPAQRKTRACPPCRRRFSPRGVQWRLTHAPQTPVALYLYTRFPLRTSTRTVHRPEGSRTITDDAEEMPILVLASGVHAPPALQRIARSTPLNS